MKLLIVIPALNEEKSIRNIIERSLVARKKIITETHVTSVDITVVSDGSTDRTIEYAKNYLPQVNLIIFKRIGGMVQLSKRGGRSQMLNFLDFLMLMALATPIFFPTYARKSKNRMRMWFWGVE